MRALESLGGSDVIQLKEVSGPDLEWIRKGSERVTDYKALYQKIHSHYVELSELTDGGCVLYEPNDIKTLAAALQSLLPDTERLNRLGQAGKAAVFDVLDVQKTAEKMVRILDDMTK